MAPDHHSEFVQKPARHRAACYTCRGFTRARALKDVSDVEQHNRLRRAQSWLMAGSLVLGAVLVWLLLDAL